MPPDASPPTRVSAATVRDVVVRDVMVRAPRTLPVSASVGQAIEALRDDHIHLLLLVDGQHLCGTLDRADLAESPEDTAVPALAFSTLDGRTVQPDAPAPAVMTQMRNAELRRLAVTDAHGRLLGLLCLKRHGDGFCTDEDVASRGSRHP